MQWFRDGCRGSQLAQESIVNSDIVASVEFSVCTSRSDFEKTWVFQTATVLCMILSLIT